MTMNPLLDSCLLFTVFLTLATLTLSFSFLSLNNFYFVSRPCLWSLSVISMSAFRNACASCSSKRSRTRSPSMKPASRRLSCSLNSWLGSRTASSSGSTLHRVQSATATRNSWRWVLNLKNWDCLSELRFVDIVWNSCAVALGSLSAVWLLRGR